LEWRRFTLAAFNFLIFFKGATEQIEKEGGLVHSRTLYSNATLFRKPGCHCLSIREDLDVISNLLARVHVD
jgi:hypothetical protein